MSKNNEKPLVSIITVCYNSEKYIRDTIESVLNQTYDNIEYIIVDGESTDNTLDIIQDYEPKFNGSMYWISEPDNGIYDAMNKGIDMANGEIIGIINSDDWYEKNAVEFVVNKYLITDLDDKFIFHGNMNKYDSEKNKLFTSFRNNKFIENKIEYGMPVNHPSVFVSEKIYKKIGNFNTKFKIAGDYDFIYRCYNHGIEFVYINKILCNMRLGGISDNLRFKLLNLKETYYISKKHSSCDLCITVLLSNIFKILIKPLLRYFLKKIGLKQLIIKYYSLK